MAVVRVRAVASLVFCFDFHTANFALKRWHGGSKQNTTAKHNNFTLQDYILKQPLLWLLMELNTISKEAKEYSKGLLTIGNLTIVLWVILGAVACGFFNPVLGWLFLISAFALIFLILRRIGCSSCYYCKSCTMGFGKLADLFFGQGYVAGVDSSLTLRILFVHILLGVIPIAFILQEFAVAKITVLALLLVLLFYSDSRRKHR